MKTIKKLKGLFTKKHSMSAPFLIIKKDADMSRTREDANVKEYGSIEEAIADLENDSNVSKDKIEKFRSSIKILKNKTNIKIRNGEII